MLDELEALYLSHRQGLFSLALAITRSRLLAEDAVHDAFVRLCRSERPPPDNLKAYVFMVVRNSAVDHLRNTVRSDRHTESLFSDDPQLCSEEVSPFEQAASSERKRIIREAIDSLPADQCEVVVLKSFAELTFEEIAAVVGAPMKTVATRYRRALIRLEEKLRDKV